MKITVCASARFFEKLRDIKMSLERLEYTVFLPSMVDCRHLEETAPAKIHYGLMRGHFNKIDQSDAIYAANYPKDGIEGHIGGSCFLEMGKAFDRGIPIFLITDIPQRSSYREELPTLQPVVVGEDWNKLDRLLRDHHRISHTPNPRNPEEK